MNEPEEKNAMDDVLHSLSGYLERQADRQKRETIALDGISMQLERMNDNHVRTLRALLQINDTLHKLASILQTMPPPADQTRYGPHSEAPPLEAFAVVNNA